LVASAMAIIARELSSMRYADATIPALLSVCSRPLKYEAKRWGCELHDVGITDLCKHRVIRLVNQ